MKTVYALTAAVAFVAPAFADTIVFGDSLSDPGNRAAIDGAAFPFSIYPNGQFTNADAWTTQIGLSDPSRNYAVGGATAAANADAYPDLGAQIGDYINNGPAPSAKTTATIWIGGNDFRALLGAGLADVAAAQAAFESTAANVIGTIAGGISALAGHGVSDFVVFGLPDLGKLPDVVKTDASALVSAATGQYNAALRGTVAQLDATTPLDLQYFDVDAIFGELLAGGAFNFTEESCLSMPVECVSDPNQFVFYDGIHPTEAVHEILGQAYLDQVSEVPLPAGFGLLLTGLGVMAVSSRRRRSRA